MPVRNNPALNSIQETYNQVVLLQLDADPLVALAPHVKKSSTVPDISDLLVLVEVLVEERLDLLLVDVAHLLGGDGDDIAVLVAPLGGQLVDLCNIRESVVEDTKLGKVVLGNVSARVVEFALVNVLGFVSGDILRRTSCIDG